MADSQGCLQFLVFTTVVCKIWEKAKSLIIWDFTEYKIIYSKYDEHVAHLFPVVSFDTILFFPKRKNGFLLHLNN